VWDQVGERLLGKPSGEARVSRMLRSLLSVAESDGGSVALDVVVGSLCDVGLVGGSHVHVSHIEESIPAGADDDGRFVGGRRGVGCDDRRCVSVE